MDQTTLLFPRLFASCRCSPGQAGACVSLREEVKTRKFWQTKSTEGQNSFGPGLLKSFQETGCQSLLPRALFQPGLRGDPKPREDKCCLLLPGSLPGHRCFLLLTPPLLRKPSSSGKLS